MQGLAKSVHIIPLGHEYDRAIAPFRKSGVDRVHLLTIQALDDHEPAMFEKQQAYSHKVEAFLQDRDIEVNVVAVDLFDIHAVMNAVARLVKQERDAGNTVFVNMSACGRLTSVGATLAGMAHDATVYYVHADGYARTPEEEEEHGLSLCTTDRVERLCNFRFALPSDDEMQLLVELYRREVSLSETDTDPRMESEDLRNLEHHPHLSAVRKYTRRLKDKDKQKESMYFLTWLNKVFLEKLLRNKYIEKKRENRREWRIGLTESGRYLAANYGENLTAPAYKIESQ